MASFLSWIWRFFGSTDLPHHPATEDLAKEQDNTNAIERILGMDEKWSETHENTLHPDPAMEDISSEEEDECPICLTSLDKMREEKVSLPCCHSFCATCISNWLKNKRFCPVCKTNADVGKLCYGLLLDEDEREGSPFYNTRKKKKKKRKRKKKTKVKAKKRAYKRSRERSRGWSRGRGSERNRSDNSSRGRSHVSRRKRRKRRRESSSTDYRRKLRRRAWH